MTEAEIEAKIKLMQDRLAVVRHPQDIAACNRVIEKLIMMEPEIPRPEAGDNRPSIVGRDSPAKNRLPRRT